MSTIVLRSVKGTPLTNTEVDSNFTNLNTDKLELGGTYSSGTATGVLYLSSSKVLTTGSALTFDGSEFRFSRGSSAFARFTETGASVESFFGSYNGVNWLGTTSNHPITFNVNSSEGMRLTSTGLGIGTSSPLAKLQVKTQTNGNLGVQNSVNAAGGVRLNAFNDAGDAPVPIELDGSPAVFNINTIEQMRLTSTGLGIGTSSPATKLNVADATSATVRVTSIGNANLDLTCSATQAVIGSPNGIPLLFNTSNTERMRLDSSGNLGLGVTPSAWGGGFKGIDVAGSGGGSFSANGTSAFVSNNTVRDSSGWKYNTSYYAALYAQNGEGSGGHQWYVAGSGTAGNAISFTQAATLDANGKFLVGKTSSVTASPGVELQNGSGGNAAVVATADGNFPLILNRITSTGTIVDIRYAGSTVGSISYNGTLTSYNTTSDYRLKTLVAPVTGSGERLDALNPVEFDWNANGQRDRGFFAHQFQAVYPNSVTGSKDAVDADGKPVYQSMQAGSSEVIADLVAEIKSLRKRVAQLEQA